jgi:hypothetical protein
MKNKANEDIDFTNPEDSFQFDNQENYSFTQSDLNFELSDFELPDFELPDIDYEPLEFEPESIDVSNFQPEIDLSSINLGDNSSDLDLETAAYFELISKVA